MATTSSRKCKFYIMDPSSETDPWGKSQQNFFRVENVLDFILTLHAAEPISIREAVNLQALQLYGSGINLEVGSDIISGVGTSFLTDLSVGTIIRVGTLDYTFQVAEILSDTLLYIDINHEGPVVNNGSLVYLRAQKAFFPSGYTFVDAQPAMGLSMETVSAGSSVRVKTRGIMPGFSGLVAGKSYALSSTPGQIIDRDLLPANNDFYQIVGQALSEDLFFVNPQPMVRPFGS